MRVLLVSSLYHPHIGGGAEKIAQFLAEGLVARGHGTVVVTLNPVGRYEVTEVNGVRIHRLPVRNLYLSPLRNETRSAVAKAFWHAIDSYNPLMGPALGRVLDAERPDVVNTHNIAGFSASIWKTVKTRDIPLVHTAHDYYAFCQRSSMYRNGRNCPRQCPECKILSMARRRVSRLVDVLTTVSSFVQDRYDRFDCFPRSERIVIHDLNARPFESDKSTPHDVSAKALRFGYLGHLHPSKGVELLLRSFLELACPGAELFVAGRGSQEFECKLKAMTNGHRNVRWLGFTPPDALFQKIDSLVVPSLWHDPSPLVVTEAMARGIPLIGAKRGGIPELMGTGTGWIFDPDEPGSLTRVMEMAIDSRCHLAAMGQHALERARTLSPEAMVDGYVDAYSHAIRKRIP